MADEHPAGWADEVKQLERDTGDNYVTMMSKEFLTTKVMKLRDTPMLMEDLKDVEGNLLLRKYTTLNKDNWAKYVRRPDALTAFFVTESRLKILNEINTKFLNYEDFQALAAAYDKAREFKAAELFFTEALESGTADAHINMGIFWFRMGGSGVRDNYKLAQRMLNKGVKTLPQMRMKPTDELKRKRLVERLFDEIDFQMAPGLLKFFRAIFRIFMLKKLNDDYVGPAFIRDGADPRRLILEFIEKAELKMKRQAAGLFVSEVRGDIPPDAEGMEARLTQIETAIETVPNHDDLRKLCTDLGQLYIEAQGANESYKTKMADEKLHDKRPSVLDNINEEQEITVQKIRNQLLLKSPKELADIARVLDCRKDEYDYGVMLWLIKDRKHHKAIMEMLTRNPTVAEEVKAEVTRYLEEI